MRARAALRAFGVAERLPSVRDAQRSLRAELAPAYALPSSHAVLRAHERDAYRALPGHRNGFVARAVRITLRLLPLGGRLNGAAATPWWGHVRIVVNRTGPTVTSRSRHASPRPTTLE